MEKKKKKINGLGAEAAFSREQSCRLLPAPWSTGETHMHPGGTPASGFDIGCNGGCAGSCSRSAGSRRLQEVRAGAWLLSAAHSYGVKGLGPWQQLPGAALGGLLGTS